KLDAIHMGHAMIRHQQRHRFGTLPQARQDTERALARIGGHHTIAVAVALPQVALHGSQYIRVVVNSEHYRSRHFPSALPKVANPSTARITPSWYWMQSQCPDPTPSSKALWAYNRMMPARGNGYRLRVIVGSQFVHDVIHMDFHGLLRDE